LKSPGLAYVNRFVQENPDASPDNLESLQDFVRTMAYGVDGMEGNDTAALETVRNYWNCFSAGWRQKKKYPLKYPRVLQSQLISSFAIALQYMERAKEL